MRPRRGGSAALPAFAAAVAVACGYADPIGDPILPAIELPPRAFDAGTDRDRPPSGGGSQPDAAPSTTCAASGLVLCLRFENETTDEAPSALRPATAAGVTFGPGKEAAAAYFTVASALRYGPHPVLELPADSATIEAWIRRDDGPAPALAAIFDDDERFSLAIDADGHVLCRSSGGAVTGARVVPAREWAHVACVVDGATLRAYVGGVEDGSGAGAIAPSPDAGAAIGGNAPEGEPFTGAIDSLRVFGVARTAAQIEAAAAP